MFDFLIKPNSEEALHEKAQRLVYARGVYQPLNILGYRLNGKILPGSLLELVRNKTLFGCIYLHRNDGNAKGIIFQGLWPFAFSDNITYLDETIGLLGDAYQVQGFGPWRREKPITSISAELEKLCKDLSNL